VVSLHHAAFSSSDMHFFHCFYSAIVGESLQFGNFLVISFLLGLGLDYCLGLLVEVVFCFD
jgi:hypothetical protein